MAFATNHIWYEFIEAYMSFLKSVKYSMVDTGYTNVKIVDVLNGDLDDPNISTINKDVFTGNYFVKADNSIYDADKNLLTTLTKGRFFFNDSDIKFFLTSDNQLREFRENKWNNTHIGDKGISFLVGHWDIDQNEKKLTNQQKNNLPSIIIQIQGEASAENPDGINVWEGEGVDDAKTFSFITGLMCLEEDINSNITGYDSFRELQNLVDQLTQDFRLHKECDEDNFFTDRYTRWGQNTIILNEYKRPVVVGALLNTVQYR